MTLLTVAGSCMCQVLEGMYCGLIRDLQHLSFIGPEQQRCDEHRPLQLLELMPRQRAARSRQAAQSNLHFVYTSQSSQHYCVYSDFDQQHNRSPC